MLKKSLLFFSLALCHQAVATFVVDTPGTFGIGSDILYLASGDNEPIFEVTVSDVILDFQEHLIQQDLSAPFKVIAVLVDPNLTNVIIQNGNFDSINGQGVNISSGCSDVTISNMEISNLANEAIISNGTVGSPVSKLTLQNTDVVSSSTDANNSASISLNYTNIATLLNVNAQENGANNILSAVQLNNCKKSSLTNCSANLNTALGVQGFHFFNSTESVLTNCIAFDNIATTSSAYGFFIEANSSGFFFQDCIAQGNLTQATTGFEANGFYVLNASSCDLYSCDSRLNEGTGSGSIANGFKGANSSLINLVDSTFSGNKHTQSLGDAYGINWNNLSSSSISNCLVKANTGLNNAIGCNINNCNHCSITNNQFIFNNGGITNIGLNVLNTTKRITLSNVAFDNGITATTQIIGLTASETDDINSSSANLGAETSSWINLRIF